MGNGFSNWEVHFLFFVNWDFTCFHCEQENGLWKLRELGNAVFVLRKFGICTPFPVPPQIWQRKLCAMVSFCFDFSKKIKWLPLKTYQLVPGLVIYFLLFSSWPTVSKKIWSYDKCLDNLHVFSKLLSCSLNLVWSKSFTFFFLV